MRGIRYTNASSDQALPDTLRLRQKLLAIPPLLAVALVVVTGCWPQTDRLPISGKITLDGQPLDDGTVRFTSKGSEKLSASGAAVQNGEYHIPQDKGLPPGTYHVEISAPDLDAPPVVYRAAPGEPSLPPGPPERIPPEYNTNSNKTISVTAEGDNHFEFNIATRSVR